MHDFELVAFTWEKASDILVFSPVGISVVETISFTEAPQAEQEVYEVNWQGVSTFTVWKPGGRWQTADIAACYRANPGLNRAQLGATK